MAEVDQEDGPSSHCKVGERVRIFRRGRNWHARFQHNGKQHRIALGTRSKKEAMRRAAQIDVQLTAGLWRPPIESVTVGRLVELYLDKTVTEGRAPSTISKYQQILAVVVAFAEGLRVRDVAGLDLSFYDAYRKMRIAGGAAPKTLYNACVLLRQLILFALSRNLVASDPMKGIRMAKPKPTKQPCWTREQVLMILAAAEAGSLVALTLLAELGLRFGELAWLTWDDVDFKANIIHIRPKPGWTPKSRDHRIVPMNPTVRELLGALPRTAMWVAPMPPSRSHQGTDRQWSETRLLQALKRVLNKLCLVGKLHTFRHSFISHALLSGTPVVMVREWVGHVDPHVIDLYTHVHQAASQAAMEKLSRAESPAKSQE